MDKITAIFVAYSSFHVGYTTVETFHGTSLQSNDRDMKSALPRAPRLYPDNITPLLSWIINHQQGFVGFHCRSTQPTFLVVYQSQKCWSRSLSDFELDNV